MAPLRALPGCHSEEYILLDVLHIFHLGIGMDAAASTIVLLAKLGHFTTARKFDNRLAEAFRRFDLWCRENKHTTSIGEFTADSFGMKKFLV